MFIEFHYLLALMGLCLFAGGAVGLFVSAVCQISGEGTREEEEEAKRCR